MAKKKNFKSGLTNIIEESLNILSSIDSDSDTNQTIQQLQNKIALLEKELYLWRTGKLTLEKFNKSLQEHGLKYNPQTNQIEKIS